MVIKRRRWNGRAEGKIQGGPAKTGKAAKRGGKRLDHVRSPDRTNEYKDVEGYLMMILGYPGATGHGGDSQGLTGPADHWGWREYWVKVCEGGHEVLLATMNSPAAVNRPDSAYLSIDTHRRYVTVDGESGRSTLRCLLSIQGRDDSK
ncbi:uncharacterized protein BO96DRAFT_465363 [Aspergillus niger CBS 101883]|uniref:Uncharacterized protein n=2 Tax=Aspergillus niger TaxID=5061 RepID=A2QK93_ASPNC|nr:uncharacterized protein BO96DRAFT_465363 [Aspergillus niger CBS 101883]XP_059600712.1 hypothetical protein An04g09800 [Aspergillus niger]PYH57784.1 hypothetical protein BO96DRAFT_465363 [Aspergillus niger CBS 101883]CAK39039.1 hypothetical protein An04g09800 [Aspergillus niger]